MRIHPLNVLDGLENSKQELIVLNINIKESV